MGSMVLGQFKDPAGNVIGLIEGVARPAKAATGNQFARRS